MDDVLPRPRELLVAGHVNVDRVLSVGAFPDADRTVPVLAHRVALGGTATNLARVASRYGVACGIVADIGDGFPEEFLARLERDGIDLRGLKRVAGVPTPTCFIVEDQRNGQRTFIDQGPMGGRAAPLRIGEWIREYSWLHVGTGDPDRHLELARAARNQGLRVAADPAQEIHYRWDRARLRRLLSLSEILFGNRSEIDRAVRLLGVRRPERLLEYVPLVVRTEGARGARAFSRVATVHVPALRPRRVRTTVGAGDAFRGGFYAAWFAGEALPVCLTAGNRAAARWVERPE